MSGAGRLFRGLAGALVLAALAGPAGTHDRAAHECEIVLGAALSLTGPRADGGLHVKNGYDFAVERLNEAGGVEIGDRTCTMRVVYYDARSEPARAAELVEMLVTKEAVRFLLGPHDAALTEAIASVAEAHAIPMVAAGEVGRALLDKGLRQLFAVAPVSARHFDPVVGLAVAMARVAGKEPGEVRVAALFATDPTSLELRDGLFAALQRHGFRTVVDARLAEDPADMAAPLALAKGLRPDLLVVSGRARGAATAVRQIRDLRVDVPMVAVTHCEAGLVRSFGAAAEGVLCPTPWAPTLGHSDGLFGTAADYAAAFRAAHPDYAEQEVPYQAAQASAAVLAYADAFRRAGSLEPAAVREALAATDLATFYGPVSFAGEGGAGGPVLLRQIQDGGYAVVAPAETATAALRYPRGHAACVPAASYPPGAPPPRPGSRGPRAPQCRVPRVGPGIRRGGSARRRRG